jgi:hypothetical protein
MARIFAGELSMIDQEVFDALKQLSDAFWVFAEINIGRNIDWFIIRPDDPSTLILTELKRINKPLRGAVNGLWEKQATSGEWEELPANGSDTNPYWQAVNSANALADWLWNNQQLYRETAEIRPSADFRVWPDLLLLSPPGTLHRLPLAPPSRYGRWWFNIDEWLRHVRGWTPRTGVSLSPHEVRNLIDALRLTEIWSGNGDAVETPAPPSVPITIETSPSNGPANFASYLQGLEQRIARLEHEIVGLRQRDLDRDRNESGLPQALSPIDVGLSEDEAEEEAENERLSPDAISDDPLAEIEDSDSGEYSSSTARNSIPSSDVA